MAKNTFISKIVENKELFTIIISVIIFSISVGKALSIADDGLETAKKVDNVVSGSTSEPGLIEKIRLVESEINSMSTKLDKLIVLADAHDKRINMLESTKYTPLDAAKDREIFLSTIEKLRSEIHSNNITILQRLATIEAKISK